ncbi:MAG TPA: oligoendopeptidase F [Firmicutes bacterium]|jgi:oligoendopeptidase F|nr:oligoendopeptidase F [Bacillota bacterium]
MEGQQHTLPKREELPREYRWNLEHLYSSLQDWEEDLKTVEKLVQEFESYQGKVNESAATLLTVLTIKDNLGRLIDKVFVYARMKRDENNADSLSQAMTERAQSLAVRVGARISFFLPEVMTIPQSRLKEYFLEEPDLELYRHFFTDITRRKQHILSPEEERILALSGEISDSGQNIFTMLNNADLRFPIIHDEQGQEVELTHGRYLRFLESKEQKVRKDAFLALHQTYHNYRNTLAASLNAGIKSNIFYARARHYSSAIEAALDDDNIQEEVYENLVTEVRKYLPVLHQFLNTKQKLLNLEEIHLYDLYVSPVTGFNLKTTYEEAKEMVKEGLHRLGKEYRSLLNQAFTEGWIDVYENRGKTSGAYSWGCYDSHPYVLLNFQDTGNDLFTLAHELGHALHSYLSNQAQPYIDAQYPIFLAEIASTVNEVLLVLHRIEHAQVRAEKIYYLHHFLEHFRTTVFRQTMFADFEKFLHEQVENGEALTPEWLEDQYSNLVETYHGPEVVIDPEIAAEWSRIPHFFYNFYVYKYATGFCAAVALVQRFRQQGEEAVRDYLQLLKSGGSDYPLTLLKRAGVDLSQPQPIVEAMSLFEELVNDFNQLVTAEK